MQIEFQGATRTVTGSMHLLHINGATILLDCGLFQGRRQESTERNKNFPFDPASIDVVVLSHAHIDHSGNLPQLVKKGFLGPIYSTPATRDLCTIMLADSAFIQEKDAEFLNKKLEKRGGALVEHVEPLYTPADAIKTMKTRGAPLIGACGAYGLAMALDADPSDASLAFSYRALHATRPTAINLRWALDCVRDAVTSLPPGARAKTAYQVADRISDAARPRSPVAGVSSSSGSLALDCRLREIALTGSPRA